jgi:hypothetical protein
MKKVFFGLLVAAVAVGGSAFTNAHKKATVDTYYYKLNQAGTIYTKVGTTQPSLSLCKEANIDKCVIGFDTDEGATVLRSSLPATPVYTSPSNGYIN